MIKRCMHTIERGPEVFQCIKVADHEGHHRSTWSTDVSFGDLDTARKWLKEQCPNKMGPGVDSVRCILPKEHEGPCHGTSREHELMMAKLYEIEQKIEALRAEWQLFMSNPLQYLERTLPAEPKISEKEIYDWVFANGGKEFEAALEEAKTSKRTEERNAEDIEAAYWNFDALKNREGRPATERDAFKMAVRSLLHSLKGRKK